MSTTAELAASIGETRCSYHPDVETRLRCSRCGKPICPRCAVRTPVGLRCPDCAGVRGLPTYATAPSTLARAGAQGLAVAAVVGLLWGFAPEWGFYLALLLGFGAVETMARASSEKRGRDLQLLAMAICLVGFALSRAVLAQRLGVDLGAINDVSPRLQRALYLRPIPDLLFGLLPLVVAWIRFR